MAANGSLPRATKHNLQQLYKEFQHFLHNSILHLTHPNDVNGDSRICRPYLNIHRLGFKGGRNTFRGSPCDALGGPEQSYMLPCDVHSCHRIAHITKQCLERTSTRCNTVGKIRPFHDRIQLCICNRCIRCACINRQKVFDARPDLRQRTQRRGHSVGSSDFYQVRYPVRPMNVISNVPLPTTWSPA